MVKKVSSAHKLGPLQRNMDKKVSKLVLQLLDERTQEMKAKGQTIGPFSVALVRNLSEVEIVKYAQSQDRSFGRIKEENIRKSVQRTLKPLLQEEEEEIKNLGINPDTLLHSEDVDDNNEPLMEVQDLNKANKSIVEMWKEGSKEGAKEGSENLKGDRDTDSETRANSTRSSGNGRAGDAEASDDDKRGKKRVKHGGAGGETKRKRVSKKDRSPPNIKLSSLGGLDDVITELMETVGMPILHPEIYSATGIEPPRGVLLHGPPGCGKTTIANALAGELQVPFIPVSAPSVVSGMSGESEKKVREIFAEAKRIAPCLVFIDEIDAITPKRDGGAQREMEKRIVAQLLTCLDDLSLEKTGGRPVIVIGATNRPDSLDTALRRAGRFDREICISVPDEEARARILESMTHGLKISGSLGTAEIAKLTPGFVGADLRALVTAAGVAAIKRIFSIFAGAKVPIGNNADDADEDAMGNMLISNADADAMGNMPSTNADENTIGNMLISNADEDAMDVDAGENHLTSHSQVDPRVSQLPHSVIQKFLETHPQPLTEQELAPLCITKADFLSALPMIQPTAKREGFATIPDVTWDHVGALRSVRVELHMAIVQPIKRPDLYRKVGITAPGGVLMWGPPGCGKTLLAKAVANESKANFISVKGPELLNKFVGESERAVRKVFSRARASVPCIIFFDELDALVPRRDSALSEASSRVVNTLLTELDGLNDRHGIFVIGATNRPDMIDPAMLRPGRLDKTLYVQLPSPDERFEILKTIVRANHTPVAPSVDLSAISRDHRCKNFSGADISSLVKEASVRSLKRVFFKEIGQGIETVSDSIPADGIVVSREDFESALSAVKPSVSDRDRLRYERLNRQWSKASIQKEADEKPAEA
ncbi:RIX7 [Brettanomyces bruxellensis]|uniref:DEBR0S2_05864g1_1 n=1 Tax=Dekkera bruxellensis TaxID=5007 RepID=A0A7D9H0M7_DEKBR|nr:RIX7 [Brettanomyces bruxellensis]